MSGAYNIIGVGELKRIQRFVWKSQRKYSCKDTIKMDLKEIGRKDAK
jgi:hypothetical protein